MPSTAVPGHLQPQGKKLFSFAVVADTHINQEEHISSSPYQTNKLANARARHVFLDIAAMDPQPSFVIHLGDIVNPVPSLPTFDQAVAHFKDIIKPVRVPVHVLPGNHDVGDKRIEWMPAEQVCDEFLDTYRRTFGPDFFSFVENDTRFILINSLLINSGLGDEAKQKAWLEAELEKAGGQRVFLFMHYPPYIYSRDEKSNYDNLDEPGRSWLLALMERPNVEAVFAGHVHNFWYDRVGNAEFYMLPSTAFLRHDFTEFYRVAPQGEFGRGDLEKFGYFMVDVYESGHVAYSLRTSGRHAAPGATSVAAAARYLAHPKVASFDRVGVELRHPWSESMQITATGGVQEFGRKWARNDYPLQALWEMGARLAKVPDIDVTEDEPRSRMAILAPIGHQYVVTTLGMPKPALLAHDLKALGVIGLEVNLTKDAFASGLSRLQGIQQEKGVGIFYSKLLTVDPAQYDGQQFSHMVHAGFRLSELDTYREQITQAVQGGAIRGITVRVEPGDDLIAAAAHMDAYCKRTGAQIIASLKMAGPSIAMERADDIENVAHLAKIMVLARHYPGIRFIYDTFMDVDRGYFPRHAFIDRQFNPRPMARAYAIMMSLLSHIDNVQCDGSRDKDEGVLEFSTPEHRYQLISLPASQAREHLGAFTANWSFIDLLSGAQHSGEELFKAWQSAPDGKPNPLQVVLASTPHRSPL